MEASWRNAPCPAVVVDATGAVRTLNDAARTLFPQAAVGARAGLPDWLSTAGGPVAGAVAERSFLAHPVPHEDGAVSWWLLDDTALRVEQRRTALLTEMSTALMTSLNPERCMHVIAQLATTHLADAALVIAPAATREHPVTRCARGAAPTHEVMTLDVHEVVGLSEALRGFPPVPSRWIDPKSAPDWLTPKDFGDVGSIVVTPLPGHGVPAGALVLLRRTGKQAFSDDEEAFARLFASRAGVAMSAARMFAQQASITETLTRDLLPPVLCGHEGVEFAGRYRASADTERVGGDFYDVHELPGGELFAVLGDVCGKGLEAAAQTGKVRTTLQALLPVVSDHHQMLSLLNGALLTSANTRFVTVVVASVRPGPDGVRLRLTSGGHTPPLVVRRSGAVEVAETRGTLVGLLPEIRTSSVDFLLAPGETCLLYTDGITEAMGGPMGDEMFGEERLQRALTACGGMPAEAVVEHVHMLAAQWVGAGTHDDMAVLAISAPRS